MYYFLTCTLQTTYVVFTGIIVALFKIFNDPNFAGNEILPVLSILFITYGICTAPWVYLLSFLFKSPTTAYVVLFCINFFLGFAMLIVDFIVFYVTGGVSQCLHVCLSVCLWLCLYACTHTSWCTYY